VEDKKHEVSILCAPAFFCLSVCPVLFVELQILCTAL